MREKKYGREYELWLQNQWLLKLYMGNVKSTSFSFSLKSNLFLKLIKTNLHLMLKIYWMYLELIWL